MEINRKAIKHNALLLLAQTRPSPILVILVYILIDTVLSELVMQVSGLSKAMETMMTEYQKGDFNYIPDMPSPSAWAWVLIAALTVMVIVLFAGLLLYCLRICQLQKAGVGDLFDGFALFGKFLGLALVEFVFIYLWSLLLIVPGILAFYRYRQAFYILLENPELGILECLRRSTQMMDGRKWELFVLDLSFLGWYILTWLPGAIVWVEPYTRITYTNYYLALRDLPRSNFDTTV